MLLIRPATILGDFSHFAVTDDAYYERGLAMRDRVRLISLYKANDTSYRELVRL